MSAPTTRRYPRTLQEAWPSEARHAYAVEHYRVERYESVAGVLLAVACGIGLALALIKWWAA